MAPALDPLLQERVYHALKADYLAGVLVPGRRLDVQLLADRLRSSKTPVREAACIMVGQGLLAHHRDGGFTVPVDEPGLLIELQTWHMHMILAILSRLKETDLRLAIQRIPARHFDGTPVAVSTRAAEIFIGLAETASNRWALMDVQRLNDRLHYFRLQDAIRPEAAWRELQILIKADVADLQKSMRRRIESYHRRRIEQLKERLEAH